MCIRDSITFKTTRGLLWSAIPGITSYPPTITCHSGTTSQHNICWWYVSHMMLARQLTFTRVSNFGHFSASKTGHWHACGSSHMQYVYMQATWAKTLFVCKMDSDQVTVSVLHESNWVNCCCYLLDVTVIHHYYVLFLLIAASSLTSSSMSGSVTQSHDIGFVLFVICLPHAMQDCTAHKYCLPSDS